MIYLSDLFDLKLYERMELEGYITVRKHPTSALWISNYTAQTQYSQQWNEVTRQCRGLVSDWSGKIIARPFPKFHNYGEHEEGTFDLDEACVVTDKLDGSLGILYSTEDGYLRIATRGSFESDQALHATEILQSKYNDWTPDVDNFTYLFEIIYPQNRVVLDYGDMDDLVLLAVIHTGSGQVYAGIGPHHWPGPRAEQHPYETLRAALEAEPRPNAEGYVVWFPKTNERIKLKQDDYVDLHRLLFGLNERRVWEKIAVCNLANCGATAKQIGLALKLDVLDIERILVNSAVLEDGYEQEVFRYMWNAPFVDVPDEFYSWVTDTAEEILMQFTEWNQNLHDTNERLGLSIMDRKTAAIILQAYPILEAAAHFALMDEAEEYRIRGIAWQAVRPTTQQRFKTLSEDIA